MCKRVRGWTSGRSLPLQTLLSKPIPPGGGGGGAEKHAKQLTCLRHALVLINRSANPLEPTV